MKFFPWFSGAWAAVLWFFTLGIAVPLFRSFPSELAAPVAIAVFPFYFGTTIVLGILACFALGRRQHKGRRDFIALTLQILAIIALLAIPTLIQPAMEPHLPGSAEFMMLHGISSLLNLFALIVVPFAFLLVFAKRKEILV